MNGLCKCKVVLPCLNVVNVSIESIATKLKSFFKNEESFSVYRGSNGCAILYVYEDVSVRALYAWLQSGLGIIKMVGLNGDLGVSAISYEMGLPPIGIEKICACVEALKLSAKPFVFVKNQRMYALAFYDIANKSEVTIEEYKADSRKLAEALGVEVPQIEECTMMVFS